MTKILNSYKSNEKGKAIVDREKLEGLGYKYQKDFKFIYDPLTNKNFLIFYRE